MGLKWFRARLSINDQGSSKVTTMTGMYRKVSFSESNISAIKKSGYPSSVMARSIVNDSSAAFNYEETRYDPTEIGKAEPVGLLSPSTSDDFKATGEYATQDEESTISIEDLNVTRQLSINEEKTSEREKSQSDVSNIKCTCQETEIVI